MVAINLNHATLSQGIKELNRGLSKMDKEGKRAIQSVLNRGLTSMRKDAVKQAANSIGVPQKVIRKRFSYRRASPSNLRVILRARTRAINAIPAGGKTNDEGIALGPYTWEGGFIVESQHGVKVGVKRVGKKRYPLTPIELGKGFVHKEIKKGIDNAADHFTNRYSVLLAQELQSRYKKFL